jgi:hypothetical protein
MLKTASAASRAREEFCLALLFNVEALTPKAGALTESMFSLSENRELFRRWRAADPVREEESELWEHYQDVIQTRLPETGLLEVAFLDCVRRLEDDRIRAVKEASALALAEGLAGVQQGQVASIARTRLGGGESDGAENEAVEAAVSLLIEDTEASRRLFERKLRDQPTDTEERLNP